MTSMMIDTGTSTRVELELALRTAVLQASPREHGRERARGATRKLVTGLASVAGAVAAFDLSLLVAAA